MKLKHKRLLYKLIPIASLLVLVAVLSLVKKSVAASEFFTRTFSRVYLTVACAVTSIFPFSIFETFLYVAGATLIFLAVRWIYLAKKNRKAKVLGSFLNVVTAAVCVLAMHTVASALAYNRQPLPVPQYQGANFQEEELIDVLDFYFNDYNAIKNEVQRDAEGRVIVPYTDAEIAEIMIKEYKRIGTLDGYLNTYTPTLKGVGTSKVMSHMNITGIAFTAIGEGNINTMTPPLWKLHTAAHEIAHTKGVMRESDANLMAKYILLTSEDIYLRYAFYTYNLYSLTRTAVSLPSDTLRPYRLALKEADNDRYLETVFWDDYESIIDKVSDFINDTYLKLSGVDDGIQNYADPDTINKIVLPSGEIKSVILKYSDVQKLMLEYYLMSQ